MKVSIVDRVLTTIPATRELTDLLPDQLAFVQAQIAEEIDLGRKFMRMFFLFQSMNMDDFAVEMQMKALAFERSYRILAPLAPRIRVLAIVGPGTMADNAPLDFVLFGQNVQLDLFYFDAQTAGDIEVPEHDVAILALGESQKNNPVLDIIDQYRRIWPRPFLNHAQGIQRCARDHLAILFQSESQLVVPKTLRLTAATIQTQEFPYLIRPIDTHAGDGFFKIDNQAQRQVFLRDHPSEFYYLSEYIDYRQEDGLFRKMRVALIDRRPYICHYAVDHQWMVHYMSAHMELSQEKRDEEARFMAEFQTQFVARYGEQFQAMADKIGLDYVVLDCAVDRIGRLVVFEADNRGWIHAVDSDETYPYKKPIMQQAFDAFVAMLYKAASSGVNINL
jgi:glutathione synthase/RimK-type ligase-like ATP-grasp enzyme